MTWPDGHISRYSKGWLLHRSFSQEKVKKRAKAIERADPVTWHGDHKVVEFEYDDIIQDESVFADWLASKPKNSSPLYRHGYSYLQSKASSKGSLNFSRNLRSIHDNMIKRSSKVEYLFF